MSKNKKSKGPRLVGFLGVGLDNRDGEQRLTRSEHFFLIGGSKETHERMQDTAIRLEEDLRRRDQPLEEASRDMIIEIIDEDN